MGVNIIYSNYQIKVEKQNFENQLLTQTNKTSPNGVG